MRHCLTYCLLVLAACACWAPNTSWSQGMALPGNPSAADTPPSMQNPAFSRPNVNQQSLGSGQVTSGGALPRTAGQEHRVYDLRPYTGYLTKHDHPEQAIIDWVLRETGTDVWFTQPFGFLNADRDQLSVYHTNEMHQVVSGVVDRFVAGEKEPQVMNLRVMTVGNANWRSRAHMLMQHVTVDSPGVQAWLLSKENAALVMNILRQRTDARLVQDLNLTLYNGQTEKLASTRGRNYVQNVRPAPNAWPPYEPETGEVQEGYRLSLSPLLSTDGRAIDCVIEAEIDQVDKLNHVDLELPLPNNQIHKTRIDVPQVVSWRLHERFRWPSDMVLLLSCGVVASPERAKGIPMLNMEMLTGSTPGRADALLFVQFRGRASENLTTVPLAPETATQPRIGSSGGANRGRY
ncbi:hypothetical protein N9N28_03290 [Rubripirellula amarantea]|uniref:Bacterial type II and III secretion system protein n=1 Tax=Rubripirellula amarantea TaxID=2527999 RepID=A0A5C5WQV0_9BACT|nr:hypothetical protein [Rubripirellula amarantea]MDA8743638.1 hypothetical protein [Rubripirellula amarantea]TWT52413.1 hypothetical protein Pla22_00370 [Rubripirellula amarantea]